MEAVDFKVVKECRREGDECVAPGCVEKRTWFEDWGEEVRRGGR